ncbi:hypothetical protein VTK73DRAFT_765 [Phialemonium thermophilum]|uniref:N-acetyltransferase domain-containing protein n=1 Tax=Phialemonium thermophilum TaxID=223376 RepID=A0ABR3XDL4_9PEZI
MWLRKTKRTRRRAQSISGNFWPSDGPPQSQHQHRRSNEKSASHHMGAVSTITELNLSTCHPTIVDRINAVPGLRTSTAFFTFLRANLVLPPSAMSSNASTPYLEPTISGSLDQSSSPKSKSSPTSGATASMAPAGRGAEAAKDDDIPPLSLDILTKREDKADALRLVADSVAQQRQQASRNVIFHPICLAVLVAALSLVYRYTWLGGRRDLGMCLLLGSSVVITYLMAVRFLTAPYLRLAESVGWSWLEADDGKEDTIIGMRFGSEMVGALVLRLEQSGAAPGSSSPSSSAPSAAVGGPKKRASHSKRGSGSSGTGGAGGGSASGSGGNGTGRGVIRAWTTKLRFRGRGVGGDLLQEAVRVTRETYGRDAEVGFAQEHANSNMVLPEMFNSSFRKVERRAAGALAKVLADYDRSKRRR